MDPLPILNLKNVIAVDFDMRNNCVYWADIVTDTIGVRIWSTIGLCLLTYICLVFFNTEYIVTAAMLKNWH